MTKSEYETDEDALLNLVEVSNDIASELQVSLIQQLHDKISAKEVQDKGETKQLVIRYYMRWLVDMYAGEVNDPEKVNQIFTNLYYEIGALGIGTDDFWERFRCCSDRYRRAKGT